MEPATNGLKDNKLHIIWKYTLPTVIFHLVAPYGLFIYYNGEPNGYTTIFVTLLGILTNIGVTAGAHRLWSHRSYKAKAPLRFLLVLLQTCIYENSIIKWARDHRIHHKYTDTHSDPHNVTRGIFFSHIGWIMLERHPDAIEKGRKMYLSDLYNDPFLRFQHRYYFILMPLACFILPVIIPVYFWNETFINAICLNNFRYLISIHSAFSVNSIAHRFGYKPYNRFIRPTDSFSLNAYTLGEGYHNYHHTFPWDYRSSEFGGFSFNLTRRFIELCAKIGWAYDLKAASEEMTRSHATRTGDGSHAVWGWGDKDIQDIRTTPILKKD